MKTHLKRLVYGLGLFSIPGAAIALGMYSPPALCAVLAIGCCYVWGAIVEQFIAEFRR